MTYVAVKGGERAIRNAETLLHALRRGDAATPELETTQIEGQLALAVDRVMAEGSCYDRPLAALAVKQSWGDLVEAAFLVRAFRTTLPRLYDTVPIETSTMDLARRVSSIFKDVPGGQIIGPSFDYTQRLLDFALLAGNGRVAVPHADAAVEPVPGVIDLLRAEDLIEEEARGDDAPRDLTREPIRFPVDRTTWLQSLARADEGFLLGLAYSTQRGYGSNHPFAGEVRVGEVEVAVFDDELGFEVVIGEIVVTEVQMVNQFIGTATAPPQFTRGYGLTLGYNERKTMAMALVDRALRAEEYGERRRGPAQDPEFVLYHGDNVEAQGFVQHLKLPHYVDFQAELHLVRGLRAERAAEQR
ncbi:MAG TPA: carbon-phosphorus lyase complex subunit PhnI [Candidatus Elarobacter sp.]|jgi:alpha-D-ribose 1-methylphosphonate 5-triphosphate synthase subunit PhnI